MANVPVIIAAATEILKWMNAPNALKVGRKCKLPAPRLQQILLFNDGHHVLLLPLRTATHLANHGPLNYSGLLMGIDILGVPCKAPYSMAHPSNLSLGNSLKTDQRKAFYEAHKNIALVMVLVVFLFPLFGVYVSGLLGAALGMLISIAAYFLTPYVILKLGA